MKNIFKFLTIYVCVFFILSSCASSSPEVKKGDEVKSYEVVLEKDIESIDIIRKKNKYEFKVCGRPSIIVINEELKRETRLALENSPWVVIGSIASLGILTPVLMPALAGDEYKASGEKVETVILSEQQKCEFAPCPDANIIIRISGYNVMEDKQVEGLEYVDHLYNTDIIYNEKLNVNGELEKEDTGLLKMFWEEKKYLPQGIMISKEIKPEFKAMDPGDEKRKTINESELKVKIPQSKIFFNSYVRQDFVSLSQRLLILEIGDFEFKRAYIARFDDDFSKVLSREPAKNSNFNKKAEFAAYLLEIRTSFYKNEADVQEMIIKDQFFRYYEKGILTEVEQILYNTILKERKTSNIKSYKRLFNKSTISSDMYISLEPHFRKIKDVEKIIADGENLN